MCARTNSSIDQPFCILYLSCFLFKFVSCHLLEVQFYPVSKGAVFNIGAISCSAVVHPVYRSVQYDGANDFFPSKHVKQGCTKLGSRVACGC